TSRKRCSLWRITMRPMLLIYSGTALLAAGVAFTVVTGQPEAQQQQQQQLQIPQYRADSTWPKPFPATPDAATGRPRTWIPGEVAGTCVDAQDHVFIVTRGNLIAPEDVKGVAAPPVMEFNPEGYTVAAWGNRDVLPNGIHGCFVDYQNNIWI